MSSCDINCIASLSPYNKDCEGNTLPARGLEAMNNLPKKPVSEIPESKKAEMQEYAARLRKKHPHMKPDRLARKVAEYFKIKLV